MPEPDPRNLKEKCATANNAFSVYLMKDRIGQTIYVGKAKDPKKRVSTYCAPQIHDRPAQGPSNAGTDP